MAVYRSSAIRIVARSQLRSVGAENAVICTSPPPIGIVASSTGICKDIGDRGSILAENQGAEGEIQAADPTIWSVM